MKKRPPTLIELVCRSIASQIRYSTQVQDALRTLARRGDAVNRAEIHTVGESVPVASSARQVVLSSKGRTVSITIPFGKEVPSLQAWAHSLLAEQQIASRDTPRSGATMRSLGGQRRTNGHISGEVVSRGDRNGAAIKMHRMSDPNAAEAVSSSIAKTMVYSNVFSKVLDLQTREKVAELMRGQVAGRSALVGPPSTGRLELVKSTLPQEGGSISITVNVSKIPEFQSLVTSQARQLLAAQTAQHGQQRDSVKSSSHVRQVGPSVSPQATQQPGRSRSMSSQQQPVRLPSLSPQGGQQHVRSRSMTPQAAQRSSPVGARRSDRSTSSLFAAASNGAAAGIAKMQLVTTNALWSSVARTPAPKSFGVTRDQIQMGAKEIINMNASPPAPVQICSLWESKKDKRVAAEMNSKELPSS